MLKQLIKSVAFRMGYEIRRRRDQAPTPSGWVPPHYDEARRAIEKVASHTMLSEARLMTLYQQVVHCEKQAIEGSLVECGVWKGGAVGLMALANLAHGASRRHLYLFDAFQEICEPDPSLDGDEVVRQMEELAGRKLAPTAALKPVTGVYDRFGGPGTIDECRDLIEIAIGYDPEHVHYEQGWFQHTVRAAAKRVGPIALLRLDGDLYHSILVCLEHLYPNVVPGGFVVVDDYGLYEGCTKAVDDYIERHRLNAFLHPADEMLKCHAYWIKR